MSQYLVDEIEADPGIDVSHHRPRWSAGGGDGWLERVVVCATARPASEDTLRGRRAVRHDRRGAAHRLAAGGGRPRRARLRADRRRRRRPAGAGRSSGRRYPYETTVPGFFAVGDVRHGSVKRVASAVGEGSVVVSQLHQYLAATPSRPSGLMTERPRRRGAGSHRPPRAGRVAAPSRSLLPLAGLRAAAAPARPRPACGSTTRRTSGWCSARRSLSAVLAYATGAAAVRRGDARVHVRVPGVPVLGRVPRAARAGDAPACCSTPPNAGFIIATPVGLAIGSVFAVVVDRETRRASAASRRCGRPGWLRGSRCSALMAAVGGAVAGAAAAAAPATGPERASGCMVAAGGAGDRASTGARAWRYLRALAPPRRA